MSDLPSVCIMIPTYNQARFVSKAIESALAQDYSNLEIVVADDHSSDNTSEVVRPFLVNEKIKYVKNTTNLGRVANYRNCLYHNTTSDWVVNLDGDDYFTNDQFISQAMEAIGLNGYQNTLFYQGIHIKKLGELETIDTPNMAETEVVLTAGDYFFDFFKRNYFSHMSTVFNRQLAIKDDFYNSNVISSDIHSFLKLCLHHKEKKTIVSKNVSGIWLHHGDNTSGTMHLKSHWNNFKLYIRLYQIALEKGNEKLRSLRWLTQSLINYSLGYLLKLVPGFLRRRH